MQWWGRGRAEEACGVGCWKVQPGLVARCSWLVGRKGVSVSGGEGGSHCCGHPRVAKKMLSGGRRRMAAQKPSPEESRKKERSEKKNQLTGWKGSHENLGRAGGPNITLLRKNQSRKETPQGAFEDRRHLPAEAQGGGPGLNEGKKLKKRLSGNTRQGEETDKAAASVRRLKRIGIDASRAREGSAKKKTIVAGKSMACLRHKWIRNDTEGASPILPSTPPSRRRLSNEAKKRDQGEDPLV